MSRSEQDISTDLQSEKYFDAIDLGCIYVMYSRQHKVSKIGWSHVPTSRISHVRKERNDTSIELMACWSLITPNPFLASRHVERVLHKWFRASNVKHPSQVIEGEWFDLYWLTLVCEIESLACVMAAFDIQFQRVVLE